MAIAGAIAEFQENAGANYHGRDLRRIHDKMMMGWDVRTLGGLSTSGLANGGVARSGEYAVSQRGAGANMSVDVTAGGAMVGGTESATQGEYFVFNDATVNVVISASDPTNPRIDVIGIQIRDTEYSGASNDARLVVITGTPAASPAVPTVPADFLSLAHVAVAAAAASIVNANITDKRQRVSALGGVTICTSTTRPTVNLWAGMCIIETDTVTSGSGPVAQVYDGAAWVGLGQFARAWSFVQEVNLGGTGAITLSAIPATFTHLRVFGNVRSASAAALRAFGPRFNGDTAANYDEEHMEGNGATAVAAVQNGLTYAEMGFCAGSTATAAVFSPFDFTLYNYRNTSMRRSGFFRAGFSENAGTNDIRNGVFNWRNTAAVTQIDLWDGSAGANSWLAASRVIIEALR